MFSLDTYAKHHHQGHEQIARTSKWYSRVRKQWTQKQKHLKNKIEFCKQLYMIFIIVNRYELLIKRFDRLMPEPACINRIHILSFNFTLYRTIAFAIEFNIVMLMYCIQYTMYPYSQPTSQPFECTLSAYRMHLVVANCTQ